MQRQTCDGAAAVLREFGLSVSHFQKESRRGLLEQLGFSERPILPHEIPVFDRNARLHIPQVVGARVRGDRPQASTATSRYDLFYECSGSSRPPPGRAWPAGAAAMASGPSWSHRASALPHKLAHLCHVRSSKSVPPTTKRRCSSFPLRPYGSWHSTTH